MIAEVIISFVRMSDLDFPKARGLVYLLVWKKKHIIMKIMKTMCPSDYHRNGFVATHALGHMMYNHT